MPKKQFFMKSWTGMILIVAAMFGICFSCTAESIYSDADMITYGYREVISEFEPNNVFALRAYYTISLPKDYQSINEVIINAYGNFDRILLIEYGCYNVHPILQSSYVCVGATEDAVFNILPTPFDLIEKTYDPTSFDDVLIHRVY